MSLQRSVLVTGGTGFLGQRVVRRLLERGDQVLAIVRQPTQMHADAELVQADLAGEFLETLRKSVPHVDAVIHLAQAPGWAKFPVNAGRVAALATSATAQLAEFAAEKNASTFIYASSGGVYGTSENPLREDSAIRPSGELGFYLNAKLAGDKMIQAFRPAPFKTSVLRFFFLYGPGQRDEFLVARLISAISRGESVTVAGGSGPRLNPLFVEDAAAAVITALDGNAPEVVNCAGPEIVTISELAACIGERLGRKVNFDANGVPGGDLVCDISVLNRFAPPSIGITEGVSRAVASFLAHKGAS